MVDLVSRSTMSLRFRTRVLFIQIIRNWKLFSRFTYTGIIYRIFFSELSALRKMSETSVWLFMSLSILHGSNWRVIWYCMTFRKHVAHALANTWMRWLLWNRGCCSPIYFTSGSDQVGSSPSRGFRHAGGRRGMCQGKTTCCYSKPGSATAFDKLVCLWKLMGLEIEG